MDIKISCYVRTLARLATCLALLAAVLFACGTAQAQNSPEMAATYGRGIHAYFDNQTSLADENFSRVIRAGTTDPRVYYYRAVTRMRSGLQQEAEEDMRIGAAHEASNPGNRYAIGKALERIQGPHRQLLEKFRQQARMDRLQQLRQQTRQRYEQLQQREPAVLRREMHVPLDQLVDPSLNVPAQLGFPSASPLPGSATPAAEEGAPAEATPAPSPEVEQDDPFATGPAEDDIFGEPEAPAPEDDPFSAAEPSAEPAEEDDPFDEPAEATDPAPAEDDIFGEPEPDEKDEEPVQEEDDLFGETAPKTEPSTGQLQPSNQVESGQMAGILGRVVGGLFPWRGMEIPSLGPGETGAEIQQVGSVELGPFDEQPEVIKVSAVEPLEGDADTEDFFGEGADDSASESADDPFDVGATDVEAAPATEIAEEESSDSEQAEPETDDPFGDF